MKVVAAILAAGRGDRFGGDKTQAAIQGRPLWRWSFEAFVSHPEVDGVGLVGSSQNLEALRSEPRALFVIEGGPNRVESSRRAVLAAPAEVEIVLIHDAARPFVSERVISDVIAAVRRSKAAAPGLPVTDTIKRSHDGVLETVDRSALFAVQTPQGATRELFVRAHERASSEATDDLQLFEAIGVTPELVPGDPRNAKITLPEDLARLAGSMGETRTGMGYDVHAFSNDPKRPLMLGGVRFDGEIGLDGHSDADVLLHAVVDALLGAAGKGDIGQHFSNRDLRWKDCPSTHFLRHAGQLLKEERWNIQNLDITVVAEHPKLMTRADEICRNIASALEIDHGRVNLKATTNERLGFIGRGEGIAAMAVATLARL